MKAVLTEVILPQGVGFGSVYGVFAADGAVHVAGEPVLTQHPSNLCGIFVACDQGCIES